MGWMGGLSQDKMSSIRGLHMAALPVAPAEQYPAESFLFTTCLTPASSAQHACPKTWLPGKPYLYSL